MTTARIFRGAPLLYARDSPIVDVLRLLDTLAPTIFTPWLRGPSGAGKTRLARYVHDGSDRAGGPFKVWHAAEGADGLAHDDLSGHAKGAFTSATAVAEGVLRAANGGTLVIDDADKMSKVKQEAWLRLLDDDLVRPTGSRAEHKIDVRYVLTSICNLDAMASSGGFLAELLNRFNPMDVVVPSLRERPMDVALIANFAMERIAREFHKAGLSWGDDAIEALQALDLPGNVRELTRHVTKIVLRSEGDRALTADDVRACVPDASPSSAPIRVQRAREIYEVLLKQHRGNVSRVAKALGEHRLATARALVRHGLDARAYAQGGVVPRRPS